MWPALDQFFAHAAPPLRGSAALRLAPLASPQRGGGRGKKDNLQKDIYTPHRTDTFEIRKASVILLVSNCISVHQRQAIFHACKTMPIYWRESFTM